MKGSCNSLIDLRMDNFLVQISDWIPVSIEVDTMLIHRNPLYIHTVSHMLFIFTPTGTWGR